MSAMQRFHVLRSAKRGRVVARFLSKIHSISPREINFPAADGHQLHGVYWGQADGDSRGSVMINGATGIKCSYYANYAQYLSTLGLNVLIYDYRGIGVSRPDSLIGFKATKRDWGIYDTEGAILKLVELVPKNQPLIAVCSSIGGFTFGLAHSSKLFHRALFVGCQYAYCGDYLEEKRRQFWFKWHVIMPAVALLVGYFPGKYLGFCEDLPRGIALEWGLRYHPSFHQYYHLLPHDQNVISVSDMKERMTKVTAEILNIAHVEDEFATPEAVYRLMSYFPNSDSRFVRMDKTQLGSTISMEHVGFFNKRFTDSLWPLSAEWVLEGTHPWVETSRHTPASYIRKE